MSEVLQSLYDIRKTLSERVEENVVECGVLSKIYHVLS